MKVFLSAVTNCICRQSFNFRIAKILFEIRKKQGIKCIVDNLQNYLETDIGIYVVYHSLNPSAHSCITAVGPRPVSSNPKVPSQPETDEGTLFTDDGFRFFLNKLPPCQV